MEKQRKIEIAKELLAYLGINARQLSEELGLQSPQWFYDIMNPAKSNGFSRERSGKIAARWPQIDPSYLFEGEGSLLKTAPVNVEGDQHGNIYSPGATVGGAALDKLVGVVDEQSKQVSKLIEQNGELLSIIKNLSK